MPRHGTNSNEKMEYLRVREAQTVRASVLDKAIISASRLTRGRAAPRPGGRWSSPPLWTSQFQVCRPRQGRTRLKPCF